MKVVEYLIIEFAEYLGGHFYLHNAQKSWSATLKNIKIKKIWQSLLGFVSGYSFRIVNKLALPQMNIRIFPKHRFFRERQEYRYYFIYVARLFFIRLFVYFQLIENSSNLQPYTIEREKQFWWVRLHLKNVIYNVIIIATTATATATQMWYTCAVVQCIDSHEIIWEKDKNNWDFVCERLNYYMEGAECYWKFSWMPLKRA